MTLKTLARAELIVPVITYAAERPQDAPEIDALVEAAFGPGRYAKAAERLREANAPRREISVCARSGETLVGAVRMWPVLVGETSVVFLGPIAVEAGCRKHGVGAQLVERACHAAERAGDRVVLLVGDPPFFGPLGFEQAPASVRLPGPVDPRRVLWRPLVRDEEQGVSGLVRPSPPLSPPRGGA